MNGRTAKLLRRYTTTVLPGSDDSDFAQVARDRRSMLRGLKRTWNSTPRPLRQSLRRTLAGIIDRFRSKQ